MPSLRQMKRPLPRYVGVHSVSPDHYPRDSAFLRRTYRSHPGWAEALQFDAFSFQEVRGVDPTAFHLLRHSGPKRPCQKRR